MSQSARHTPNPISPAPTTTTRGVAQPARVLPASHRDRGVGEGGRALADPSLRAHPLARLEGVPEEGGEDRAAGALLLRALEGAPDLAHHLGLARHHRLEA